MPAAMMWAHGQDERPIVIAFEQPEGSSWKIATRLHPGSSPLEFTAPNLQYSWTAPLNSARSRAQFTVGGRRFRIALHHLGTDAEFDTFAKSAVVREEGAIYGEFRSTAGHRSADYLPWADGDGMEHQATRYQS
jgi:predicted metalloprotease with PDZ domain